MTTGPEWEDGARRLVEGLRAALGDAPSDGGGECRWCPHCQLRAVLRGERPEVSAALADVLVTTAGALRAFTAAEPGPDPAPATASPAPATASPAPAAGSDTASPSEPAPAAPVDNELASPGPVVQRIELA